MCGISGIYNYRGESAPAREEISVMCRRLEHRGLDGTRVLTRPRIGLGHTRLSIIDLTTGWQPLANEDGTVWVILNGEI